jgi:hypothetical protein
MIVGLLRARLQGARRIPLSIGKFLVGFEPLRQILGAPHGYRSVELSGGTGEGKIESIEPIEIEEEISLPPARFAIGNEVESKHLPCRLVANARPVYLLGNGKYRNTTGHFELAVLDAGGQLLRELSPDAIGRIFTAFTDGSRFRRNSIYMGVLWSSQLRRREETTSTGVSSCYRKFTCSPLAVCFLVNHNGARYQTETLELLGLRARNIIRTYPGIKLTADELVVPSHSSRHEAVPAWVIQFMQKTFLRQSSAGSDHKKLFLDRGAAKRRTILNQPEVHRYIRDRGYTIVDSARLSFPEQASLLRSARSIVSCHGASLANLCFVDAGTSLLEIFSPFYTPDYFRILSQHLGILYGCMSGVPFTGRAHLTERKRISRRRPAVSPKRFEGLCHHATGDKLSRSRFRRIASTRGEHE